MREYDLNLLGLEISFKAEVSQERIDAAVALVQERFDKLSEHGKQISKERILIYLALGLADDLLQLENKQASTETRISALLDKIR